MNIVVENYADYKEKEIFGRYINNDSISNLNSNIHQRYADIASIIYQFTFLKLVLAKLNC